MRRVASVVFSLILAFVSVGGAASDTAAAGEPLPAPTGPNAIGRLTCAWTDVSRLETMVGKPGLRRELLVHIFYPAGRKPAGPLAAYFPNIAVQEAYENEHFGRDFFKNEFGPSYRALFTARTHAVEGADPVPGRARFPVVIFSHGGGIPVLFYTALLEDLASHGWVVAAVEHTYDGDVVVYPDGHIVDQTQWDQDQRRTPEERARFHRWRYETGAADDSFVLDQLEKLDSGRIPSPLAGRIDTRLAAAAGHSFGGMVSLTACERGARFRAGVNLDGGLDSGTSYGTIGQPVMAMFGGGVPPKRPGESAAHFARRRASDDKYMKNLHEEFRNVRSAESRMVLVAAPGFSHFSYYDKPTPEVEGPWVATSSEWRRNKTIIRGFLLAFLDRYVLEKRGPLWDSISKAYPEIRVEPLGPAPGH